MSDSQIKIKTQKCEVFIIDYSDFEKLVKKIYGKGYDYLAQEEAENYSYKLYEDIRGKLDDSEEEEIYEFQNTKGCDSCSMYALLQDLCKNNHIEPGNYLIKISW